MKDWRQTIISPEATLAEAIGRLDQGGLQVALVVDQGNRLVGMITDGDIRRSLLRGVTLSDSVDLVVNENPAKSAPDVPRVQRLAIMRKLSIRHLPLIDPNGVLVGLDTLEDIVKSTTRDNAVVIMAGGMGKRLRPLTEKIPKPMLHVGGRPLAETIVRNLVAQGFWQIYLSVNYRAERIEEHFRDGADFGASVRYLREPQELGTAGALGLLPAPQEKSIIVMNGDILTTVDFVSMLDFHNNHDAAVTMAVRDYHHQIPYGVVTMDDLYLKSIVEKPTQSWFISAGIYIVEPSALESLSQGEAIDMPSLLDRLKASGRKIAVFPIREYWLDIGRIEDFERAVAEFPKVFQ